MAIYLSDLAQVNISYQKTITAGARFGIPLLFGYESGLPSNISYIGSEVELEDTYGLSVDDPTYVCAQAIFAQADVGASTVPRIAIAKRLANVAQVTHVTFSGASNAVDYTVTITADGVELASETITSGGSATMQEIVEALASALNGSLAASTVAVTEDNTKLILTAEVAGVGFSATASSTGSGVTATIATATANRNAATQLSALTLDDPDEVGYYYVIPVGSGSIYVPDQDIRQITEWAEAQPDVYLGLFLSDDADLIDTTVTDDIGSVLKAADHTRCAIWVDASETPIHCGAVGWHLGRLPSVKLGAWHHIELSTELEPSSWSSTQMSQAKTKRVNAYYRVANTASRVLMHGRCISQLELRQRVGLDSFIVDVQVAILDLFQRTAQAGSAITNTPSGRNQIASVIDPVLRKYSVEDRQLFTTSPRVDMSEASYADGTLSGIRFVGDRADAILLTIINGQFK
jgi:hypothetical protein